MPVIDRPIAQSDIAAHLGIGQKTVSRVFGGGPVSAATRTRVLEAAKELGYRPNAGARAMRTGRTGTIVLLQSTRESASSLPGPVLAGIGSALAAADANLLVAQFDDERLLDATHMPKALRELTCDGVLVNYDTGAPERLPAVLRTAGLPAVWLNSLRLQAAVRPDDLAAGAVLARHLITVGHRRLAWADLHVHWTPMNHYSRSHRRDGFLAEARAAGVQIEDCSPAWEQADPVAWFAARLALPDPPTAIACYGELEFLALLRAAQRVGRRVPEDLSLAGVQCGLLIGAPVDQAVFDLQVLGREAAAMLLAMIAGRSRPRTRLIPPVIQPGGSVAPPASAI